MSIWIFLIPFLPFVVAFFIGRWISSYATQALEPHHKALLVDMSTSSQKYTILWLALAIIPIFIIPQAGILIFAIVVLVGNWLALKRLWALEFPEFYKQKSLIATIVFSVGVLISVVNFYVILYLIN